MGYITRLSVHESKRGTSLVSLTRDRSPKIAWLLAVASIAFFSAAFAQSKLPLSAREDLEKVALIEALREKNYESALAAIDRYRDLAKEGLKVTTLKVTSSILFAKGVQWRHAMRPRVLMRSLFSS